MLLLFLYGVGPFFGIPGVSASKQTIEMLDRYHGQPTGMFTGDEHYAGLDPAQGTELCAVVEYLFSLEELLPILGDPSLADRLEQIAYNALPAACTPDSGRPVSAWCLARVSPRR